MTDFTISKPGPRPLIITIFGVAGVGKNSLATAMCKNPIVIRAEDGVQRQTKLLDTPDAFPPCRSGDDVMQQLLWLLREDHTYTELILDSASAADALFVQDVLETGGKNGKASPNMAQAMGGYGAGYSAVAASHGRIRKAAGLLNERKGMQIVFLVHEELEAVRLPDMEDYQRFSLKLTGAKNANSTAHYVDNCDAVLHVRLASALRGDEGERKRVISNGDREIVCHATASSVTKNPWSITEPLDFPEGTNPLAPYLNTEKPARRRKPKVEDAPEDEQPDGDV